MRVRVHRGCREVGGSCVEVEAQGRRIVLDVGLPLDTGWGRTVPLPDVPGLADGDDPSLLGVFVSHPHLDHYGLVEQVAASVPVYAGRAASSIVEAARFFSPSAPSLRTDSHLEDGVPVRLGPFTVTPHLVDHSAFDSYALLVEANGEALLYTGDLRGHGRKASLFEQMLRQPPAAVDTLLMEGTHVSPEPDRSRQVAPRTERQLEFEIAATLRATDGLAVAVSSAQNVDRLVTLYRAARRAGRTLVVDLYTATVAGATGRATIPQPGFPRLAVYLPQRQRIRVKESGEFDRVQRIREHRLYPEDLLRSPGKFLLTAQTGTVAELVRAGLLVGGIVIHSLWEGYLAEPSGLRLTHTLHAAGVPLVQQHTSGHASVADLQRLVAAVAPGQVVPIHTEGAAMFARLFRGVAVKDDGQWWPVRAKYRPSHGHRIGRLSQDP